MQYLALKMCTAISLSPWLASSQVLFGQMRFECTAELWEGTEVSAKEEKESRATWLGSVEACLENTLSSLSPTAGNLIWRAFFSESFQATCHPSNRQDCFS